MKIAILIMLFLIGTVSSAVHALRRINRTRKQSDGRKDAKRKDGADHDVAQ